MGIFAALVKFGTFAAGAIFWSLVANGLDWLVGKVYFLFTGTKTSFWDLVERGFSWLAEKVCPQLMAGNVMMKAPGEPGRYILRQSFERDPAAYFRSLRDA